MSNQPQTEAAPQNEPSGVWSRSEVEARSHLELADDVMRFGYEENASPSWEQKLEHRLVAAAMRKHR
jgi:hypothetical protein